MLMSVIIMSDRPWSVVWTIRVLPSSGVRSAGVNLPEPPTVTVAVPEGDSSRSRDTASSS